LPKVLRRGNTATRWIRMAKRRILFE